MAWRFKTHPAIFRLLQHGNTASEKQAVERGEFNIHMGRFHMLRRRRFSQPRPKTNDVNPGNYI